MSELISEIISSTEPSQNEIINQQLDIRKKELELKKLQEEIKSISVTQKREFWTIIFPKLVQLLAIASGVIFVYKTDLFNARNAELEGKAHELASNNIILKKDNDSLVSRKNELKAFNDILDNRKSELHNTIKLKEDSIYYFQNKNSYLQAEVIAKSKNNSELSKTYTRKLIRDVLFYNLSDFSNELNKLITLSENPEAKKLEVEKEIKSITLNDRNYSRKSQLFGVLMFRNSLGYFGIHSKNYRDSFLLYCKNYLQEKKNTNEAFPSDILNLLTHEKWSDSEIGENLEYLISFGRDTLNELKMSQICEWYTVMLFRHNYDNSKLKLNNLPYIHSFLLEKISPLLKSESYAIPLPNQTEILKSYLRALLYECPQCYFSLESTVYNKHKEAIYIDKIPESITFRFDTSNSTIRLINSEYEGLILCSLLSSFKSENYVYDIRTLIDSFSLLNSYPVQEYSKNDDLFKRKFDTYIHKNKEHFDYWLSTDRIKDFNKRNFLNKIATLKL